MSDDISPNEGASKQEEVLKQAQALAEQIEVPGQSGVVTAVDDNTEGFQVEVNLAEEPAPEAPQNQACRRCGLPHGQTPLETDEKEVREYVRRLISGQPYTKAFELFNGELTLVFRSLLQDHRDYMDALIATNREAWLSSITAEEQETLQTFPPDVLARELQIRMVFSVEKVADDNFPLPEVPEKGASITGEHLADVLQTFLERFSTNRSEDMLAIIVRTFDHFQVLQNRLMGSAFDENFYKGAGLG